MFQKSSMIQKKCCNAYVCFLDKQHVNKTPARLQYYLK